MASRLDRAAIVVRGKFVGMQAGDGVDLPDQRPGEQSSNVASQTVFPGRQIAVGTLKVSEAVKGQVSGTVKVFSGLGMGDCGAGAMFLGAVAYNVDVSVELKPIFKAPDSYAMDTCGYMENHLRGK